MEILSPQSPPLPATLRCVPPGDSPLLPRTSEVVHVAVGMSVEKTLGLLRWIFRSFGCREIGLIHVHQPSPVIPTLLGRLPASQASEEVVSAYRRAEMKETEKILLRYQNFCSKAQVHTRTAIIEAGDVHIGIVDFVTKHGIRKLVMGATSDSCFKLKRSSSKVTYTAKRAPPFCEICFVCKGKHLWTKEASEHVDFFLPYLSPDETTLAIRSRDIVESSSKNLVISSTDSSTTIHDDQTSSLSSASINSIESPRDLASERRFSLAISSEVEPEPEGLYYQLQEAMMEIERSKKEAFVERAKHRNLDSEINEAFYRAKVLESSYAQETKIREEIEELLQMTKIQKAELIHENNEAMQALENSMRSINVLNAHAQELSLRYNEAAGELGLTNSSIAALRSEIQKFQKLRKEPLSQFQRWNRRFDRSTKCNKFYVYGFGNKSCDLIEFSSSDLQNATCGFSESFKLQQGGYGCVYKGEILNRTVVIKKLQQHNAQGQNEFEHEVYVLSKLRHPHLVTLLGVCPEALSLVYKYLPNGTLHNCLFCRSHIQLTWKYRIRIVAEVSSALLFLHSCKPESIIHGHLNPGNIFLDSDFSCKIGDFGMCRLVPEHGRQVLFSHCNMEPKGEFSYTDPEYQRCGVLTNKSDVFSFGIIILQLLTGKPPQGLVTEVRRAMLANDLLSILDTTAGEWPPNVVTRLTEFGLKCSEMNSRNRPELTPEVVRELEQLHLMEERPVPSFFLCPILQEIMHDPQVASDGFTYEGSAFREWLANGRETSPMTNLKLEHINLIPNHALRFAIQNWLCQPCRS